MTPPRQGREGGAAARTADARPAWTRHVPPFRRGAVSAVAIVTGGLEGGGTLLLLALRSPSALRTGFEGIRRDPYMRVLERGCIPEGGHV